MSNPQLLFVLDEHDKHHKLVLPHLLHTPIIYEPADISEGVELSFVQDGHREYAIIGKEVLDNVRTVWWRKLLELSTTKVPASEIEQTYGNDSFVDYANRSIRRHANALGAFFQDALWVSNPYVMLRADNKAWQLRVASMLGMAVPTTIQTSSHKRAKEFVAELGGECIVKSLSNRFPIDKDGNDLMFWSQRIRSDGNASFEGLQLAPAIFQQIVKGDDVRVTVVGNKVFAAQISPESGVGPVRDWRIVGQGVRGKPTIEAHVLPGTVSTQCVRLLEKFGLKYGAIDFVVDRKGVYWFLEINPMGAWGFIEEATGQPIGKTIADLLSSTLKP